MRHVLQSGLCDKRRIAFAVEPARDFGRGARVPIASRIHGARAVARFGPESCSDAELALATPSRKSGR